MEYLIKKIGKKSVCVLTGPFRGMGAVYFKLETPLKVGLYRTRFTALV